MSVMDKIRMLRKDKIRTYALALKAGGRKPRTIETYEWLLFDLQGDMGKPTIDATAEDLDEYVAAMWDRDLSEVTIATRIQKIKTYYSWCVKRGYLDHSPAEHLMKPKPDRLCSDPMARKTFKALLAGIQNQPYTGTPRDLAILLFLGDTGCRAGEVRALLSGDVNLEKRTAKVEGKTGKRIVQFTERTARAIREWLKVRPESEHDHLFLSLRRGTPLQPSAIRQMINRHANRIGIEDRHNPHSIRHMVGQLWLDAGANLALVQAKLGHKDARTTATFYAHQGDPDRMRTATEQFSLVTSTDP